jgi:hypothetical protein
MPVIISVCVCVIVYVSECVSACLQLYHVCMFVILYKHLYVSVYL